MRWYHTIRGLTFVLLLTMVSLPAVSEAQGAGSLTDPQSKSSAEDLARALFAEPAAPVRTRGVGPVQSPASMAIPKPVVTLNVLFAPNSATVPPASYAEIDKLGTVLSWPQYLDYRVQLEGHTDNQGNARKNQQLSEKRVQSIKQYLTQRFNIVPERIETVGYGSSKPIASNDTPEGRNQNRRVEVTNLGRGR